MKKVYPYIINSKNIGKKLLAVLIDPEKDNTLDMLCPYLSEVDIVLVGGSTGECTEECISRLRSYTASPIVLFPGNIAQFTPMADALLFLSLLTARSAAMLIEPHIQIASAIQKSGIESIPMGYILIDGGRKSSVEIASHSTPLSREDNDLIVRTALAGQLLGKQLIYLEAGSGAAIPVPTDIIRAVRNHLQIPLIVGGGITTPENMILAFEAGADMVVIGNHFEHHPEDLSNFIRIKREKYE